MVLVLIASSKRALLGRCSAKLELMWERKAGCVQMAVLRRMGLEFSFSHCSPKESGDKPAEEYMQSVQDW